ncbi:flagellar assembly peptidoglycan hydrolase FlgJ [Variovorax ginsengisoli]|uniref:Peptidoglycan hydrolase FlgJ n=1 Tax=Variovorax ginsengisoli TaxID=363844 RepID=A0ABT9SEV3_9BURK|nr:flagellar assembly peptidoglycan hydrolase FlgJ [Variovorax ginsengisoli]MDP9902281.1 flagellar protein FlgJ [Variovorax ginsengisoli]
MTISSATAASGYDATQRSGALDQRFSLDVQGVDALRRTVRSTPDEGLKQVSRQVEAMFMNMVIKSMREATPSSGLLDSQSQKVYMSMLDQQLSQSLSGRGLGLAEAMQAQLARTANGSTAAPTDGLPMSLAPPPGFPLRRAAPMALTPSGSASSDATAPRAAGAAVDLRVYSAFAGGEGSPAKTSLQGKVDGFVGRMGASAQAASNASGVPAPLILAQAALESGWGQREIRGADGTQSFNLFGIKADRNWKGPVVEVVTTEYVDGEAQRVSAKFRAYGSYDEAFADYAKFMTRNPRYATVIATEDPAAAAHGLQRAGYATDPQYGNKLVRIMQKFT